MEELKTQHAAALKAVEAENRKKLDEKRKANGSKVPNGPPPDSNRAAEYKDGRPVFGSKPAAGPATVGLFESEAQQPETKPPESVSV